MTDRALTRRKRGRRVAPLLAAASLGLSLAVLGAPAANAGPLCMKHDDLTAVLEKHKETQAALGVASNGSLIQVYTTEDGATWSIVMTNPQGVSCVMAVGKDWDQRKSMVLGQAS